MHFCIAEHASVALVSFFVAYCYSFFSLSLTLFFFCFYRHCRRPRCRCIPIHFHHLITAVVAHTYTHTHAYKSKSPPPLCLTYTNFSLSLFFDCWLSCGQPSRVQWTQFQERRLRLRRPHWWIHQFLCDCSLLIVAHMHAHIVMLCELTFLE